MEFIVVGLTFWFLMPSFIIFCLLFYCAAEEMPGLAVIATILYVAILQLFSNFSFVDWISLNTWAFLKYCVLYVILGVIFAVAKFWMKLIDKRRDFDREFQAFLKEKELHTKGYTFETIPDEHKPACYRRMRLCQPPTLSESTRNITFWMGYWPIVGAWTLLNNPLKWMWEEIKHKLAGTFEGLHRKIVGTRADELDKWRDAETESHKTQIDKPKDWKDS